MPRPCSKDRPASSGFLRPDDLNRLIHLTLRVTAAGEPFSQPYDNNNAYDFSADLDCLCGRAELLYHEHIGYQHTARNPAQQARAQGDHDGETIDKLQDYCAAPDNDGHADDETENHVVKLVIQMRVLGRACNGDDVVQTHDKVGDKNGLDRAHDRAAALDVAVFVFVGNQRSEEHTSELQSLLRISYAVFCLKKKIQLLRQQH